MRRLAAPLARGTAALATALLASAAIEPARGQARLDAALLERADRSKAAVPVILRLRSAPPALAEAPPEALRALGDRLAAKPGAVRLGRGLAQPDRLTAFVDGAGLRSLAADPEVVEIVPNTPFALPRSQAVADLIGGQVDYHEGYVVSLAVDRDVTVAASPPPTGLVNSLPRCGRSPKGRGLVAFWHPSKKSCAREIPPSNG